MPEFTERLRFYLSYSFACHVKDRADFFEGARATVAYPETKLQYLLLPLCKSGKYSFQLFLQHRIGGRVSRGDSSFILYKIPEMGIAFITYRRLQGDGFLRYLKDTAHLLGSHPHLMRYLLGHRFPP